MSDLSKSWGDLTNEEKSSIAMSLAGKNHMEVFEATLGNFNSALRANVVAQNAAGSAAKENAKYMDSIEGKVEALKSAWSAFSNSMLKSDTVKTVLSGLTGVLKVLASDAGQFAIKMAAIGAGMGIVGKLALKAIPAITSFGESLALAGMAFKSGGLAELFTMSPKLTKIGKFFGSKAFAAGLPVAIALASVALAKYVDIGSSRKAKKGEEQFKKTSEEVETLTNKLQANRDAWNKLREKQSIEGLTQEEELELALLKQETDELKAQLALKQSLKAAQADSKWQEVNPDDLTGKQREKYLQGKRAGQSDEMALAGAGAYNDIAVAVSQYTEKLQTLEQTQTKVDKAQQEYNKAVEKYGEKSQEAKDALDKWTAADAEHDNALGKSKTSLEASQKALKKLKKTRDQLYEDYGGKESFMENAPEDLKKSAKEMERLIKVADGLTEIQAGTKDANTAFKELGKTVGVTTNQAGKIDKLKLGKFQSSLMSAGASASEVLSYVQQLASENPNMTVTLDGEEVVVSELGVVDGQVKELEKGATVPIDIETNTDKLSQVDKLGKGAGITIPIKGNDSELQSKLKTWSGEKTIGTRNTDFNGKTKDVFAKYNTWKGTKTIGTRYIEFKAKKVGKWPEKHGTRNFQGFAKGGVAGLLNNAQVNEQGFEIIQDGKTGAMRVANAGHRGDTYLNRGDAVYTHGQSMRMLARAGLTEADILQGKTGDVGVFGVKKLEGFKKGKKYYRKQFDNALATLEYERNYYNWTDAQFKSQYDALYNKYKKWLTTDQTRSYNTTVAEINRSYAKENIDTNMELFENQQKTYKDMYDILKDYYDKGMINAEEYNDYLKELNEQQVENLRDNYSNQWDYISSYIQRQIDLEEENNDLLEAQAELLSATTQKVKVYKEGIGFVYEADESAVKEAQENLKSYSSVWEQIQDIVDDVESQIDLKQLATKAGSSLVQYVANAGTDLSSWSNLIKLVGGNMGAYDLAGDLGIIDPNSITKATTINGQTFNIDNISLPQVTNANEFVSELQTLAIQASASRG